MLAGPRLFQSYLAIADDLAACTMGGGTTARAAEVSESGAMSSKGVASPSKVCSMAGTTEAKAAPLAGAAASSFAWKSAAVIRASILGDIAASPARCHQL